MLSDAFKPVPVKDSDGNEVEGLIEIQSQKVNKVRLVDQTQARQDNKNPVLCVFIFLFDDCIETRKSSFYVHVCVCMCCECVLVATRPEFVCHCLGKRHVKRYYGGIGEQQFLSSISNMRTHTHTHIYIYIEKCFCLFCVCMCGFDSVLSFY